jgi:hypothetical protein
MIPKKQGGGFHNEGVYGNVHAKNIAIGRGASAVFTESDRTVLEARIQRLEKAVAALGLPAGPREQLDGDVSKLRAAATDPEPDPVRVGGIIETIAGKLKMLGEASKGTIEIVETLVKIGGFFHLSASVLGLL